MHSAEADSPGHASLQPGFIHQLGGSLLLCAMVTYCQIGTLGSLFCQTKSLCPLPESSSWFDTHTTRLFRG